MDLDKTNFKKNQERMRMSSLRLHIIERACVLSLVFLILGFGIYFHGGATLFQEGLSRLPSFGGMRSDVLSVQTDPSLESSVGVPMADRESGNQLKGPFFVGLTFHQAGDIRSSIDEKPTLSSPLYAGRGIDVYRPGKPTTTLYAFAVDPFGNVSEIVEYTYNFVPAPVSNFRAVPRDQGRVDLTWDASTDPDLDHYNVYVGDNEPVSARKNTAYTVSGLPLNEQTFSVTAVDKYKMESEKVTKKMLLSQVTTDESGMVHGAGVEISPDLNADGVVDAKDARILFEQLQGGVSAEVLNEMMQCWEKEGCL